MYEEMSLMFLLACVNGRKGTDEQYIQGEDIVVTEISRQSNPNYFIQFFNSVPG